MNKEMTDKEKGAFNTLKALKSRIIKSAYTKETIIELIDMVLAELAKENRVNE